MSSKELVIASNRHETKLAILEDDQLVEVYFQRANEYSLAGSIHKGRVTRVLPGMQSAFVDLGLERDTFLYVSDFFDEHEDIDPVEDRPVKQGRERGDGREPRDAREPREGREPREAREPREGREPREAREPREGREPREAREPREGRERREPRESREAREAREARDRAAEQPAATPADAEIVEAAPVEGAESAPSATDKPEREERGDRGDRRGGRRGRRRRRGGRGTGPFPDSKYASDVNAPGEDADEPEATAEIVAEPPAEFFVLPGESLAKYRGAAAHTVTESEPAAEEGLVAEPDLEPATVPVTEAAAEASDLTNPYDEAEMWPPENAVPDAPAHVIVEEPVVAEESEDSVTEDADEPGPAPLLIDEVVDELSADTAEEESAIDSEEEAALDAEEEAVLEAAVRELEDDIAVVSVDEDSDIREMILSAHPADEAETEGEAQPPAEEGNLSAAVRDPSLRFTHRVSRRMRRRGRGGQNERGERGGENREAREPREPRAERTGEQREAREERPEGRTRNVVRGEKPPLPSISDLLKEGQEIIVQIAKEPLGQKGARITSHIALPGRYVVFMPTLEHMGVSRKIGSDDERIRLKRILQAHRAEFTGGFITRTAAEGRTEDEILNDMRFLYNLWTDIKHKAEKKPAPLLLHHDLDIVQRTLRDQVNEQFKAIWCDNEELYESVVRFVERFQPGLVGKIKLYTRPAPIFDAFNITQELEKALRPKVWLKSGGYIVINQTEALVAIDVNTGKYVGKSNRLEDTIVKTNTEAVKEIVRQVRLRDLGGIIVIDFIDMDERKNRQKVMQALEEAMRSDRAPYKILQFNDFGLVAVTRKRVKQSLERTLCAPCPHCDGAGYVKSVQTVIGEILTEARKMADSVEGKEVMLRVHPEVAKVLKSHQNKYLEELEEVLRRPVLVKSDQMLHHEKFDLA
jgi:ribonuclease G